MSELTVRNTASGWLGAAAMMLAAGAVLSYGLALSVDDGFYTVCGVLGIAAFAAGRKARRSMDPGPAKAVVLVATIAGALAGAVVIVCSLAFGISYLV
jgi:hypothetical protein